ncbi:MAG: transposase [Bacteroidales bacterium]|nr:transposase [Bacteroidales bacterium]MBO4585170.1 transposase [Bacteroidales bacterium]
MKRIVTRTTPDGYAGYVQPFHICMKGLEKTILCRDDDDYDALVKVICVSARRKNVIVIIYTVVSNHCHVAVLAKTQADADAFAHDLKKVYSMWFSKKYGEKNVLHRVEVKAICLDNEWYTRNALAYIPRNSLDNGCNVNEYPWSGYRAMFKKEKSIGGKCVSKLKQRERLAIMHTGDDLRGVKWLIDSDNRLIPESFCDTEYLEQAFENDQAFFLKTIGGQNSAEMKYTLEDKPYQMMTDNAFLKSAEETCQRWFKQSLSTLSEEKMHRLIPYLYHTSKTSISQLARVTGMDKARIEEMLRIKTPKTNA